MIQACKDEFGLPCVHLVKYPLDPENCQSSHGLLGYGPMHRDQSGVVVCAWCGTAVYGLGNSPEWAGVRRGDLIPVDDATKS